MVGFDHIILLILIIKNYTSNGGIESGAFAVGVCCKILSNTHIYKKYYEKPNAI